MTRYDWSKLDDGWHLATRLNGSPFDAIVHTDSGKHYQITELEMSVEPYGEHTKRWIRLYPDARAQLAKCRIRDTEPESTNERATPTNAELMAQLERMQADVEVIRTELAAMRNPTDERDWQALTEENERLRDMVLERDLELSVAVERLKKLGWKEAE